MTTDFAANGGDRNIFSQGEPNFEEYNNKTVLLGYNDETDIVVVIGLTGS